MLLALAAAERSLTPQRIWLERLAPLVPAEAATHWLLLADLACLIVMGLATPAPLVGVPVAVIAGFLLLNGLGMAVTDFYLGLAVFHVLVGAGAALGVPRARWVGAATLTAALLLGVLT